MQVNPFYVGLGLGGSLSLLLVDLVSAPIATKEYITVKQEVIKTVEVVKWKTQDKIIYRDVTKPSGETIKETVVIKARQYDLGVNKETQKTELVQQTETVKSKQYSLLVLTDWQFKTYSILLGTSFGPVSLVVGPSIFLESQGRQRGIFDSLSGPLGFGVGLSLGLGIQF